MRQEANLTACAGLWVTVKGTEDPTARYSVHLSQDKQEWRTKEVGMERRLLPGVPAALSLDSRTQSGAEQF